MHGDREISLYHLYTAQQGTHPFMHPPFARLQGIYSQSGLDCTHTYGALLLFPVTEITIMSQSASSILPMLGRRKSYVSQHGLESVLTDLKACGLLADDVTSSRSSIKRAREEDLASHTSVFGPLVQKMEVPVEGQCNKTVVVPYIHSAAFLKHVFSFAPLWDFLRQEVLPHKATPCYDRPWGLIFMLMK